MSEFRRRQMMAAAEVEPDYLTFTALQDNSSVELRKVSSPTDRQLLYRVNKGIWQAYVYGDVIPLNNGDNIQMRLSSGSVSYFGDSTSKYYRFYMSGKIAGSGNIQWLIDSSGKSLTAGGFARLFDSCSSLVTAPRFPATSVGNSCYYYTFYRCSSLTEAPELPAEKPSPYCYYTMFANSGVKYVKIHLKSTANSWSYCWLQNVPSNGTLVCDQSLTLASGRDGLPSTWTRLNLDGTPYVEQ